MKKIKLIGVATLIASLTFCSVVSAKEVEKSQKKEKKEIERVAHERTTEEMYVDVDEGSTLNIRKGPNMESEIVASIPRGGVVDHIRETKKEGWSSILYNGDVRYVANEFLAEELGNAEALNQESEVIETVEEPEFEMVIVPQPVEEYVEPVEDAIVEEPALQEETYIEPEPEVYIEPEPAASSSYLGTYYITHYCNCVACCGQWAGGNTAFGAYPTAYHTIATGDEFGFGTQLEINGVVYTVEDRGVGNGCIDIYCDSHDEALSRGAFYADVYLVG